MLVSPLWLYWGPDTNQGTAASREAAMAPFAKSWRGGKTRAG